MYDFVGIVGQALHMAHINIPFLDYCSENAGEKLAMLEPTFDLSHPDPRDLNVWCNQNDQMEVFDRYIPEDM